MSTTTDHGDHVFQCDEPRCRETLETSTSNFDAARNLMRRAGWAPYRIPGDGLLRPWRHRCAACMKERGRRAARNGASVTADQCCQ
jgi:hypothetical protein